jgi:hypothetical protein
MYFIMKVLCQVVVILAITQLTLKFLLKIRKYLMTFEIWKKT